LITLSNIFILIVKKKFGKTIFPIWIILFIQRQQFALLEEEIRSHRYRFDLMIDVFFKAKCDLQFKTDMRALGLDKLVAIKAPCSNNQYRRAFFSLNFKKLSNIYLFQKKILKFVKDNEVILNQYESIIARLILY
jgi:hypothetical protein